MIDLGFMYATSAAVCCLIIVLIFTRVRSESRRSILSSDLFSLLFFFALFCMADCIWGLFASKMFLVSKIGFTIASYGFHLGCALSAFLWFGYMINYIGFSKFGQSLLNAVRYALALSQIVMLVSNFWTKGAFWVDDDGIYHTGFLRTLMFCAQFAYYVVIFLVAIHVTLRTKKVDDERKKLCSSAIFISAIPTLFGIFQWMLPDCSMYSFGFAITAVVLNLYYVSAKIEQAISDSASSTERKLTSIIQNVTRDYEAIYYVDTVTKEFDTLLNPDKSNSGSGVLSFTNTGVDFFNSTVRNIKLYIYEEDQEYVTKMMSERNIAYELFDKNSFSFTYRLMINNVPNYCELTCMRPNDIREANKLIFAIRNINEATNKQIEQNNKLKEALELAKASDKAKTSFLFNMSHDIRTPMNAILGFTDMAKKHATDKEKVDDYLEKVSSAGDHLLDLINDVLDMARIQSGKIELNTVPIHVNEIGKAVIPICIEEGARKNVTVNFLNELDTNYCIYADPLRLKQISLNLIGNAIKYSKTGGTVNVYMQKAACDSDGKIAIDMIIEDNGIGMSKEFMDNVFEPFEREKSTTQSGIQGTGLGLSIVKSLVDIMQGDIKITSTQGIGTKAIVSLVFDIAPDEETIEYVTDITVAKEHIKGKKILLVEDNPLNREIAVEMLTEELGLKVDEADTGAAAVQKVADSIAAGINEYYDAILMDIQMPVMDGLEATSVIRNLDDPCNKHIPIIAMTANAFAEDKNRAIKAGMDDHVAKPIDVNTLCILLSKYL